MHPASRSSFRWVCAVSASDRLWAGAGSAFAALSQFFFCGFNTAIYAIVPDCVEYGEWKTGVRTQAINVTANGVGQKIGSGLGTAAFGGLLTMCGYNGMAEVQTASAVSCIRIIFIVAPIAIYLILIVLAWLFKLDKQFPQIQKELEERKRSKAAVN